MKKHVLKLAVMLMSIACFTACSDSDSDTPTTPVYVSNGFYLVCSGNTSSGIDGCLTYFDYSAGNGIVDAFKAANGKSLGQTVNDAFHYGNKLYIVVDGEHKVFVTNVKDFKLIGTIDMTAGTMLGEQDGAHPRRITANEGNIYVSTYGGYVAAIDTINFALKQKYKAGSYPEGIAVHDGYLYVANSDYGMGANPSISKINLTTGADTPFVNENIRNPQEIAVAGTFIYYLDFGQYGPAPTYAQENAGVYRIDNTGKVMCVVPNATAMATSTYDIYTINAPYGQGDVSYSVYNIQTGSRKSFTPANVESPACIGVDPVTQNVMIASYHMMQTDWGPFADYSNGGYVNIYDPTVTTTVKTFNCGVGPQRFSYNLDVKYVPYTY